MNKLDRMEISAYRFFTVLGIVFFTCAGCLNLSAQNARIIAKTNFPSIVLIEMYDESGQPVKLGSGFFVRRDLVVTNYHVISGSSKGYARIVGNPRKFEIEGTVGIDKTQDLALLKLSGTSAPALRLADVSKIEVGQEILVLGNPKGLEGTITPGIISGLGLRKLGNENLIQISAPISPGSSGGPVVNLEGDVIGVTVGSLEGGQSLNFAIPSSYVALLLANTQSLVPLQSNKIASKEEPRKVRPSFETTANWLATKLGGTQYVIGKDPNNKTLVTLSLLNFNQCQMKMTVTYKTGSFITAKAITAPLGDIINAEAGLADSKAAGIWLEFIREVTEIHSDWNGNSSKKVKELKVPVTDMDIGARGAKAFLNLAEICSETKAAEPF